MEVLDKETLSQPAEKKAAITTWLVLPISSGLGLGYMPVAPGTFGTLLGLPCYYALAPLAWEPRLLGAGLLTLLGVIVSHFAGRYYREPDSGHIVIDEVAGYVWATVWFPFSWLTLVLAFLFFRLYDIFKPWPASYFDRRVKNGLGVMLDDVVAGVYAAMSIGAVEQVLTMLKGP